MITAYGMVDTAVAAMKAGAFDYLNKPFNLEGVKLSIRKGLETSRLRGEVQRLRQEQQARFSLERVGSSPATFDYAKLDWMNGDYLRALPVTE